MVKKIEILKDHAHLLAQLVQTFFIAQINLLAIQLDRALIRQHQAVQTLQKCTFPAARGADQGLYFAPVQAHAHPVEDALTREGLADIIGLKYRYHSVIHDDSSSV